MKLAISYLVLIVVLGLPALAGLAMLKYLLTRRR